MPTPRRSRASALIEEHRESDGHEEMYVVLRGRATFALGDDEVDAPAGTIVYARPGTKRGAIAAEDAYGSARRRREAGRSLRAVAAGRTSSPRRRTPSWASSTGRARSCRATIDRWPDAWQGFYNAACIEARFGDPETAIAHLKRSVELDAESTKKAAASDSDLDSIRERPDYPA